jgi:hypothetical protein
LLTGGISYAGAGSPALDSIEIFDPVSGSWSRGAPLTQAPARHAATLLHNGRLLVEGGQLDGSNILSSQRSSEFLGTNPASLSRTPTESLNVSRSWHTATLLRLSRAEELRGKPGRVLVVGGFNDSVNGAVNSCEIGEFGHGVIVR